MNFKRVALYAFSRNSLLPRFALALAAMLLFAGHAFAQTSTWTLDPNHTSARFTVRHLMITNVTGNFTKVSGTVQYDPKDLSKTQLQATIEAASLDSGVAGRDKDVRDNYLEVEKFPAITFQSKRAESAGAGKAKITGDLTIHGVTKEVTLDVTDISEPLKREKQPVHIGAVATTRISRKDFGITRNTLLEGGGAVVGDEVTISIDIDMMQGGAARGPA